MSSFKRLLKETPPNLPLSGEEQEPYSDLAPSPDKGRVGEGFLHGCLFLGLALLITACSGKPDTGPEDVRWDRETCARCAMAVSDRHYAAQIRGGAVGGKAKVYKFDDIGCAVIWLDQQPWKDNPATEIWVNDFKSGNWIDARQAWYLPDKITPMAYGLGAQPEQQTGALDFNQAREHIYQVEARYNIHGGAAHPPPAEESAR